MPAKTLGLFEQRPLARTSDPDSSHIAAESAAQHYETQREMVLAFLGKFNGSTSAELAVRMGVDRYMPARRLADLKRDGRVVQGPIRPCRASNNRPCVTWFMAETFGPVDESIESLDSP